MQDWNNFFYLCGSIGASLTGLVFIAITFGARFIRKENLDRVNTFFSPICFHFVHAFLLSAVALVPVGGKSLVAAAALVSGLYRLAGMKKALRVLKELAADEKSDIELSDWILMFFAPTVTYVIFIISGVLFLCDQAIACSIFALGLLALLSVGVRSAWDMLVWLATKTNDAA